MTDYSLGNILANIIFYGMISFFGWAIWDLYIKPKKEKKQ